MHAAGPSEGSVVPTIGEHALRLLEDTRAPRGQQSVATCRRSLAADAGDPGLAGIPLGLLYALCAALAAVGRRRGARLSVTLA